MRYLRFSISTPARARCSSTSISRQSLLRRVAEIRQQGEVKVRIPIREMMNLQGLDQAINAFQAREHRGHDHHRAAIGSDAGGKIQAREQAGFHQQRGQPVHQRHGQLAGAKEENQGEQNEFPSLHFERLGLLHEPERGEQGEHPDAARIERQRKTVDASFDDRSPGPPHLRRASQHGLALVDQIEAHMGGPVFAPLLPGTVRGQLDGALRDLRFRELAVPGQELDRMAIAIAGRKIHLAVNVGRVGAQGRLDQAQGLHELLPVHGAQETQTGNAVADGNLVGRLVLTLQMDQLFDGQPLFHEPLFEPAAREMQHRTVPRQTLAKFRHERTGEGQIGFRHVRHHHHEVGRVLLRHVLQAIHPQVRQIAILPGDGQPGGDALEVFNQPQPQHDGNGPQLAQFQGCHRLVGGDEGAERSRINLRIHVRDQFEHDVVNARQSGGRAVHEAGQLPAVAPGQMPPGHLDLLFDQVEVVEQPFGGGSDAPAWIDGAGSRD